MADEETNSTIDSEEGVIDDSTNQNSGDKVSGGQSDGVRQQERESFHIDDGELDYESDSGSERDSTPASMPPKAVGERKMKTAEFMDKEQEEGEMTDSEEGQVNSDDEEKEASVEKELEEVEDGEVRDGQDATPIAAVKQMEKAQQGVCKFFLRGQCTWGNTCKYLHPGVSNKGNYDMFPDAKPVNQLTRSGGNSGGQQQRRQRRQNNYQQQQRFNGPRGLSDLALPPVLSEVLAAAGMESPIARLVPEPPKFETAWERGLKQAKELVKKAVERQENEPDFEEKRLTLPVSAETENRDESDSDEDSPPAPPSYNNGSNSSTKRSARNVETADRRGSGGSNRSRHRDGDYTAPTFRSNFRGGDNVGYDNYQIRLQLADRESALAMDDLFPEGCRRSGGYYKRDDHDTNLNDRRSGGDYFDQDRRDRREGPYPQQQQQYRRRNNQNTQGRQRRNGGYEQQIRGDRDYGNSRRRQLPYEEEGRPLPYDPPSRAQASAWRDPWRRSQSPRKRASRSRSSSRSRHSRALSSASSKSSASKSSHSSSSAARSKSNKSRSSKSSRSSTKSFSKRMSDIAELNSASGRIERKATPMTKTAPRDIPLPAATAAHSPANAKRDRERSDGAGAAAAMSSARDSKKDSFGAVRAPPVAKQPSLVDERDPMKLSTANKAKVKSTVCEKLSEPTAKMSPSAPKTALDSSPPPTSTGGREQISPPKKRKADDSASSDRSTAGSGTAPGSTKCRREELMKQLKAVEDAIARKRTRQQH